MLSGPKSSSFWFPRNLSNPMERQARTGDTLLVKSREMTAVVARRRRGKDDRKLNILARPRRPTRYETCHPQRWEVKKPKIRRNINLYFSPILSTHPLLIGYRNATDPVLHLSHERSKTKREESELKPNS